MSDYAHQGGYDAIMLHIDFVGEEQPWTYPLALNGREIECVTIGGVAYTPVRECELEYDGEWMRCTLCGSQLKHIGVRSTVDEHGACVHEPLDKEPFCSHCGAKVVGGE